METVDYSSYEEQIRRLVDKQVIGKEVREPDGVYLVHQLGQAEDPEQWSAEKTRNETDLIRTRLRKTIEQELAEDPYAQKVFGELLRQAIAEAEAMFDHPLKQYALFKDFEEQLAARKTPGVPDALDDNAARQGLLRRHPPGAGRRGLRWHGRGRPRPAGASMRWPSTAWCAMRWPSTRSTRRTSRRRSARDCCRCCSARWAWTTPSRWSSR